MPRWLLLKQGTTDKNPHHQQHKPEGSTNCRPMPKLPTTRPRPKAPAASPCIALSFMRCLCQVKVLCRTGHRSGAVRHWHLLKCLLMICTRMCEIMNTFLERVEQPDHHAHLALA